MAQQTAIDQSLVKAVGVLGIWLAAAIAVSGSGILYDPPRPILPIIIWAPVVAFLAAVASFQRLRPWILSIDLRWPIAFHIVRAPIGTAFLLMEAAGRLPPEFAVKAGIGDIVIGVTAIFAIMCVPLLSTVRIRVLLTWNILGLTDILMVIVVAQRLLFFGDDPKALVELTRFPTLVVPKIVVPLVSITYGKGEVEAIEESGWTVTAGLDYSDRHQLCGVGPKFLRELTGGKAFPSPPSQLIGWIQVNNEVG